MTSPFDDLYVISSSVRGGYGSQDSRAFTMATCASCGAIQMAVLALSERSLWMKCTNCGSPHVRDHNAQSPSPLPLTVPVGVVGVERDVWMEVRACLAVNADTAAVMLCRKLLFHLAVRFGLPPKNGKDSAPTFAECVNHLESEGIITTRMRKWVDRIKVVGNEANHELVPIDRAAALDVASFTQQVLRLSFEMDALVDGTSAEV